MAESPKIKNYVLAHVHRIILEKQTYNRLIQQYGQLTKYIVFIKGVLPHPANGIKWNQTEAPLLSLIRIPPDPLCNSLFLTPQPFSFLLFNLIPSRAFSVLSLSLPRLP